MEKNSRIPATPSLYSVLTSPFQKNLTCVSHVLLPLQDVYKQLFRSVLPCLEAFCSTGPCQSSQRTFLSASQCSRNCALSPWKILFHRILPITPYSRYYYHYPRFTGEVKRQRDESIPPRPSASRVAPLCETHQECFGQGRCRLSPHLNTDRQKILCFLHALPSVAQGLLAEPGDLCVFLSTSLLHSPARCLQQTHTQQCQAQHYCLAEWPRLTRRPQNTGESGKDRHTVS